MGRNNTVPVPVRIYGDLVSQRTAIEALRARGIDAAQGPWPIRRPLSLPGLAVITGVDATWFLSKGPSVVWQRTVAVVRGLVPPSAFSLVALGLAGLVTDTATAADFATVCVPALDNQRACCQAATDLLMRSIGPTIDLVDALADPSAIGSVLTNREFEIAQLMAAGLSNKEIAKQLVISQSTVKAHVHTILCKTGCRRRYELRSCTSIVHG